ncbi:UDP-N-acetylmuramoyl-L-alanyl-D-glutamate--2,6-diaminopimelate ligase [bacterium BMS3Abin03]|jgi:UDP-N-acetylmuramoyl-L-alanyl-D-glutamate--2,6-diaminopimelate ligase|nr:UDP-N-acetylmuramoyl-L-alanyl-D-glutamate--2,6-diaminopimelate ligase [bacterium BMS3Abin03]MCG6958990.1 UDP-N-acetylmuramoyl-L-alanyl-D-glutamate--2,6-diaminopimelate ligase [bacterium BMS3Abin03]
MKLSEFINGIKVIQVAGNFQDEEITGIEYDSRNVKKNSVFVAIKGFSVDGRKFIPNALLKGACAIILDQNNVVPDEFYRHSNAAKILVNDSRTALAELSNLFFNRPSEKLNLIGVTGTNGKTTTAYIIRSILENAGYKSGLLGTISNQILDKIINSKLTTPESRDLNELLSQMVNEKCNYAVMEVSSHSLALNRVHGLNYSSAIFTNLTNEHLDFHLNFESYLEAKKKLFDNLSEESFAVYNSDDSSSKKLIQGCRAKKYSYGTNQSDFLIKDIKYDINGTSFTINYKNEIYPINTSLVGEFNAYNASAAFATAVLNGINEDKIIEGIKKASQVPGRFEVLIRENRKIVIDYSHTPDSLEKTLRAIHGLNRNGDEIVTVFGCGGNRDKSKRPAMGRIAAELSDRVIITSDNPRFEDPFEIINSIKAGISKKNYDVIENREEAIKKAISNSKDHSIILIAGKGHEDYQEIKGTRIHFSDREVAKTYLNS